MENENDYDDNYDEDAEGVSLLTGIGADDASESSSQRALKAARLRASGLRGWDDELMDEDITVPIPKFGGIMCIPGKEAKYPDIFAWSGTDPDSDMMHYSYDQVNKTWTIKDSEWNDSGARMKGPMHHRMYRPRGIKNERRTVELCTTYDGEKFGGLTPTDGKMSMPLKTFKDLIRAHHISCGMWDVFHLRDPKSPDKSWDLFKYHARLPKTHVESEVLRFKASNDVYIAQNLRWSGEYLRNAISAELLEKLLQEVTLQCTGPVTYAALMRIVHSDSYVAMEQTRVTLEKLSLKDYNGENIEACNKDILRLADILDGGGALNNELLGTIAQIYEGATDTKFSQWATREIVDPVIEQIEELRVIDRDALKASGVTLWNHCTMVQKTNKKYKDMCDGGRYSTQITEKPAEEPMPTGYLAMSAQLLALTAELKQVKFAAKSSRGTDSSQSFSGACHKCGKTGHRASDCTGNADKLRTVTINGTEYGLKDNEWKSIVPTEGHKPLKIGRNTWRWCATCTRWMFHDKDHHAAWADRQAARQATAAVASVANSTPSAVNEDDEDGPFFGMLIQQS